MTVKFFGILEAEGSELECAGFCIYFLEFMKLKHDKEEKDKAEDWLKKFGDLTFEDLMKREMGDEEEE